MNAFSGAVAGSQATSGPSVVVDFAHTPDALERALHALRGLGGGKLFAVFGAGGDRDTGKRSIMGAIAADVADAVVVTDDNPRSEDGDIIAGAIEDGIARASSKKTRVAPKDLAPGTFARARARRFAIRTAIAAASEDDVILLAGKGAEDTQTVGARVLPFDDALEAGRALRGEPAPAFLDDAFIRAALAGRQLEVRGTPPGVVRGVFTDSRRVEQHGLFVALVGENFDGHAYVQASLTAGAAAALVARSWAASSATSAGHAGALYVVDDTLLALQDLARAHLARLPARRIAITGSNGKTTTKQLVNAALAEAFGAAAVVATVGNLNNHIGLPLTALTVEPEHEAAILEMGMNHLGEIDLLTAIAAPNVGVITNMGTAHAGNVGGVEGVATAKAELWERMAQHARAAAPAPGAVLRGVAIVNADDPRCVREAQARSAHLRSVSFGRAQWADVRLASARDLETGGQSLEIVVASAPGSGARVESRLEVTLTTTIPLEGRHNALNACAAIATGVALGIDPAVCARGIAKVERPHGRLERTRASNGAVVLDDTYNANPDSMEAAFAALDDVAGTKRKIIALGEMRELGSLAEQAHRHIGAAAAQHGAAFLFACGEHGKLYGEGAALHGLAGARFVWAADSRALAPLVHASVEAGDVVLVKGSRGARMEHVVSALIGKEGAKH